MTNEVTPEQPKSKRDELVDALELDYVGMALYHKNRAIAERIVDRVIQAGWQWHPPKLEDIDLDHNRVALPTPEQEVDILDRIVHGLPVPEGVKLYDVASLYPQEVVILPPSKTPTFEEAANTWVRVPNFDNYEVNCLEEVRNRFTRRTLDFEKNMNGKYVEMHDKEGFAHYVSVEHIVNEVFGN